MSSKLSAGGGGGGLEEEKKKISIQLHEGEFATGSELSSEFVYIRHVVVAKFSAKMAKLSAKKMAKFSAKNGNFFAINSDFCV